MTTYSFVLVRKARSLASILATLALLITPLAGALVPAAAYAAGTAVANAQSVSTVQDTALPITLTSTGGVSYAVTAQPTNGTLDTSNPDTAQVVYTPNAGYVGSDSFAFTASDGTDDSDPAIVTINVTAAPVISTDVYVNADGVCAGSTPCYATIQAGVDAANVGDTVHIASGTYAESVLISKMVTLSGASDGTTVVTGTSGTSYVIKVDGSADGATIEGLTVNGGGSAPASNTFTYGVWVNNSGSGAPVTVANVVVKNVWSTASGTGANGIEVDTSHADVEGVTVSSFLKRGIRFNHSTGTLANSEIIGNTVDGVTQVQNLVNLWGGSTVEISGNKLHDAATAPGGTPMWSSPAIFVSSYDGAGNADASTANIHDNEIYNDDTGVTVGSVSSAPAIDASTATISNNRFSNLVDGVSFESSAATATISKNSFASVETGVTAEETDSGTTDATIDAIRNWWGNAAGPRISDAQIVAGSSISGNVSYDPWCTNEACTSLSTDAPSGGHSSGHSSSGSSSSSSSDDSSTSTTGTVTTTSTGGEVLGASTYNFSASLSYGATGADINALQQVLIDAGYLKIAAPTGWFGPMTQAAVKLYQAAHGIPATGFVGPLTLAALNLGTTPTMSDEQRSLIKVQIDSLLKEVQSLQLQLSASTT